jgi:hypothetical protein
MKTFLIFFMVSIFLMIGSLANGQEQNNTGTKSKEPLSAKPDKSTGSVSTGSEQPIVDQSKNETNSKKGYDYYKAKSDMNSAGAKVQGLNSSGGSNPAQGNAKDDAESVNKAFNQNSARSNNPQPKK